jgi:hypothetical protein
MEHSPPRPAVLSTRKERLNRRVAGTSMTCMDLQLPRTSPDGWQLPLPQMLAAKRLGAHGGTSTALFGFDSDAGIRPRLSPAVPPKWDRRSSFVVCPLFVHSRHGQTTKNDGLSHRRLSEFRPAPAWTDHKKRWSVPPPSVRVSPGPGMDRPQKTMVCPTAVCPSFARPRHGQTTKNDGLSHG